VGAGCEHSAHVRTRIPRIAKVSCLRYAGADAGRHEARTCPVIAESALASFVRNGVHKTRLVGAGGNALLAPDALCFVDLDGTVQVISRTGRTYLFARGIGAMVAKARKLYAVYSWKLSHLGVDHHGSPEPFGDIVFNLAGHGAGMTPNAFHQIDNHYILRVAQLSSPRFR